MPRKRTPVVTGSPPVGLSGVGGKKPGIVASATVNGLNGFESGTLMPLGLKKELVPGFLNGSGVNGTAASEELKNDRATLKSPNTVRYLSQISRVKEP